MSSMRRFSCQKGSSWPLASAMVLNSVSCVPTSSKESSRWPSRRETIWAMRIIFFQRAAAALGSASSAAPSAGAGETLLLRACGVPLSSLMLRARLCLLVAWKKDLLERELYLGLLLPKAARGEDGGDSRFICEPLDRGLLLCRLRAKHTLAFRRTTLSLGLAGVNSSGLEHAAGVNSGWMEPWRTDLRAWTSEDRCSTVPTANARVPRTSLNSRPRCRTRRFTSSMLWL
mmetsp:Transcript_95236/g.296741  ORF Transcript_95236/g.296741 Transcript_95236/m.296741 type:complete len:230 (-) Transcript_95236:319-1008(-)